MAFETAKRLHAHYIATKQVVRAKELEEKHPSLAAKPEKVESDDVEEKPKKSKKK